MMVFSICLQPNRLMILDVADPHFFWVWSLISLFIPPWPFRRQLRLLPALLAAASVTLLATLAAPCFVAPPKRGAGVFGGVVG